MTTGLEGKNPSTKNNVAAFISESHIVERATAGAPNVMHVYIANSYCPYDQNQANQYLPLYSAGHTAVL